MEREELPPEVQVMADDLMERLDAAVGPWRVELLAADGRVERVFRHDGPIPRGELGFRFPSEPSS